MTAPDRWFVLSVRAPSADLAPLVAEGLVALGGGAVVEDGDGLVTYLPPPADPEAFAADARARLAADFPDGRRSPRWPGAGRPTRTGPASGRRGSARGGSRTAWW